MKTQIILITLVSILLLLVWLLQPEMSFAQSLPPPPTATPIDGGLGLLASAGGAYAIKKLRDKRL